MNPALQQLKDIHLPPAIKMWPIAFGWITLYVILLSLLFYLFYILYQNNKKKKTIKFAFIKLKQLKNLMNDNPSNINIAAEISTLLRRTALYYFSREDIAGLHGQDWLNFLNRSGQTTQFTEETGRLLIDVPYRKNNVIDLMPLFDLTQDWLKAVKKNKSSLREN